MTHPRLLFGTIVPDQTSFVEDQLIANLPIHIPELSYDYASEAFFAILICVKRADTPEYISDPSGEVGHTVYPLINGKECEAPITLNNIGPYTLPENPVVTYRNGDIFVLDHFFGTYSLSPLTNASDITFNANRDLIISKDMVFHGETGDYTISQLKHTIDTLTFGIVLDDEGNLIIPGDLHFLGDKTLTQVLSSLEQADQKMTAISEYIGALESQVNELSEQIEKLSPENAVYYTADRSIETNDLKFNGNSGANLVSLIEFYNSTNSSIQGVAGDIEALQSNIPEIRELIQALDTRIDNLTINISAMEEYIQELEARIPTDYIREDSLGSIHISKDVTAAQGTISLEDIDARLRVLENLTNLDEIYF